MVVKTEQQRAFMNEVLQDPHNDHCPFNLSDEFTEEAPILDPCLSPFVNTVRRTSTTLQAAAAVRRRILRGPKLYDQFRHKVYLYSDCLVSAYTRGVYSWYGVGNPSRHATQNDPRIRYRNISHAMLRARQVVGFGEIPAGEA